MHSRTGWSPRAVTMSPTAAFTFILTGLFFITSLFLSSQASALPFRAKEKPIKLTQKGVLDGVWSGAAQVEKGKNAGSSYQWRLEFPDGDIDRASGQAIRDVVRVEAKKFSLRRPFKLKILYSVSKGANYEIMSEARLDPTCTVLSGTFRNVMGSGTFELKKRGGAAPVSVWKGDWSGSFSGEKGAWSRQSTNVAITAAKGTLGDAVMTLGDLEVTRVVPSMWDESKRGVVFFVFYLDPKTKAKKTRKELMVEVRGRLNEDFTSFSGSYGSKKLGTGTVTLVRGE